MLLITEYLMTEKKVYKKLKKLLSQLVYKKVYNLLIKLLPKLIYLYLVNFFWNNPTTVNIP